MHQLSELGPSLNLELELTQKLIYLFELFAVLNQIEVPVGQSLLVGEVRPVEQPESLKKYLVSYSETSSKFSTSASSI